MAELQTLRQVAHMRTPFSTWLGVILLFFMFGLIALALVGPSKRSTDYEQKRAAERMKKLQALREQDTAALTTYAWVDKNKGSVHIPIDRAMELAMTDLAKKKPAAAGPVVAPSAAPVPAAASGVATPPGAAAPPASPSPSGTPKTESIEGHKSKAQPTTVTNPPGAAPGSQPGASSTPAASPPSSQALPASPPPASNTPPPEGSPLPVRGKSPDGQ